MLGAGAVASAQDVVPGPDSPLAGRRKSKLLLTDGSPEDGRRTLAALPGNLGRSFVGVFSKDNLAPFLIGAGVAGGAASILDGHARSLMSGRAEEFGEAGSTVGGFGVTAPLALSLFAAGRLTHNSGFRAFTYDATQALIVTGVYSAIIKKAVGRTRPDGSDHLSFPSGHSSAAFTLATVAEAHYGLKVGIPAYIAAGSIGLCRVERNRHYLSDVLAGAALGVITGRTVLRVNGEPAGRHTRISLAPVSDPHGSGVGLGGSVSW